jgi:hypothetical protein
VDNRNWDFEIWDGDEDDQILEQEPLSVEVNPQLTLSLANKI